MKKPSLLTISLLAHGGLAFGLVVSGIWHIDQLDPGRHTMNLAVLEPPAASGSPATPAVMPKMTPKQQHIVKEIVQPVKKLEVKVEPLVAAADPAVAPGNGLGSGSGSGDNPEGKDTDTGTCKGVGCAAATTPVPEVKKTECLVDCGEKKQVVVPPLMLSALRYAGETNVMPSDITKQQMVREDHKRASGAFRVCLGTSGEITSVTRVASTKYAEYDDTLARAIHGWSYHPYKIKQDGAEIAVPACGMVTFNYTIN